ncbi:alpha/beta-hydrolase [Schizopora paradoxa]|uniref:Carboxypeptidase n=1 Tax=Schizopora paradoxa TaxID=27342 RepID=A0A0H2RG56_9AGAM|nr:alpha/beta-hydrolase [Schizopora paradoxa]
MMTRMLRMLQIDMRASASLLALAALAVGVAAQTDADIPNSFPHVYPGQPSGDYSPAWQNYFQVTEPLPNVTVPLNRNWAGSVSVNRPDHPNDTYFFWAFENQNGSFTSTDAEKPWGIWLNGGPGASSMLGLLLENGPIHVTLANNIVPNNYSWDKFMDYVWIDQPVGSGYSTADRFGYIEDEDQMAADFFGFLSNFIKVFPSFANRPLYLTGESYAGIYIPYIMKAYFGMENPPVKIVKVVMGNAAIGSLQETQELPIIEAIGTYPQTIAYDPEVYAYFQEQTHLCGYDLNLTYPQNGHFPPLTLTLPEGESDSSERMVALAKSEAARLRNPLSAAAAASALRKREPSPFFGESEAELEKRHEAWKQEKRDLSGRANGTVDPWYGCFLGSEISDYATNFSKPWSLIPQTEPFWPYAIDQPPLLLDPTEYLNDNQTRTALHAPTSKDWIFQFDYPFNSSYASQTASNPFGDPSVEAAAFFTELATNLSAHNIPIVIYSGNDDSVVAHLSSEVTIQNTTFGGIQGFSKKPQTPWYDDQGNFAGIVHQERNWTYILIAHAGHQVPLYAPESAFVFFREFVLGNNQTGLVNADGSVVGGEQPSLLQGDVLPGQLAISYQPDPATPVTSTFVYPAATVSAWETFFSSVVSASSAAQATITAV